MLYCFVLKVRAAVSTPMNALKTEIKLEAYLNQTEDRLSRVSTTKLRVSDHKLSIEKERYQGIKREERFCPVCEVTGTENIIENKEHFLIHCLLYDESRRIFLRPIYTMRFVVTSCRTYM